MTPITGLGIRFFQPGEPRTPSETRKTIKEQLWTACLGVQEAVDTIQTETGVKDKIATHWVSVLIEKARQLQQDWLFSPARNQRLNMLKGPEREALKLEIKTDIQKELYMWLLSQPSGEHHQLESEARGKFQI